MNSPTDRRFSDATRRPVSGSPVAWPDSVIRPLPAQRNAPRAAASENVAEVGGFHVNPPTDRGFSDRTT